MGLEVDGVPLDFSRYPYIPAIIDCKARRSTIVKGAQMGFTVGVLLQAIEELLHENLRGSLYLLPTDDEVQALAKSRVDPMLQQAAYAHLGSTVDTASLKSIGKGFWFFRGAGQRGGQKLKSMSKLKSFPADRLKLDEYDEMDPRRVDAARHRLDGSTDPREVGLSTPTLPGYGVDFDYEQSNQQAWLWRCDACGELVCLEDTWPDCIAEPTGSDPFFLCSKCRGKLVRRTGEWVARKPDVLNHDGWRVSQLGSTVKSAARIMEDLALAEHNGRMREFTNQVLALPFAEVDDLMTDAMLNACLDRDRPRARSAIGPCAMGVDPGKQKLHYVVGDRLTEDDGRVLDWGYAPTFDEIGQIAKRFKVRVGVMDIGAETHSVRSFLKSHPGWWGCQYVEKRTSDHDWNIRENVVKVDRTSVLDASHRAIVNGRESFPAPDDRYHETIAPQMKNLARTKIEDLDSGTVQHRWVVTGGQKDDHIKHAHAYYRLAMTKCPLAENVRRARQRGRPVSRPPSAMASL